MAYWQKKMYFLFGLGIEICMLHGEGAEDLVEKWMAFSATKLNGAQPNVDTLQQLEADLAKNKNKSHVPESPEIYNAQTAHKLYPFLDLIYLISLLFFPPRV